MGARMKRFAWMLVLVLALPLPGSATTEAGGIRWVDPELRSQAAAGPDRIVTAVLGFGEVPDLALLRARGFSVMGYEHLPVAVAYVRGRDLPRLLAQPNILSAAADVELETYAIPTAVPSNFGGTGDELTRADEARALGYVGTGVGVAVIDLGTSGLHPGLRPRSLGGPMVQNVKVLVSPGKILASQPAQSPVTVYVEDLINSDLTDGHGTHTAGIAVGGWTADGLLGGRAPGADLVAVGTGDLLALPWVLGGLEYVAANRERYNIKVVNNSWGVEGPYNPIHPVNLATEALAEDGVLMIFSAGNGGPGLRTMNAYAQAPHVLAVGATTLSGAIASFSSRGDPASGKPGPDLVAPGAEIVSGRNQWVSGNDVTLRTPWHDAAFVPPEHLNWYRAVSGTSMASPQVAGIAAQIWQANPALTSEEVVAILQETARPIVGFEAVAQGPGLVDAYAAVQRALGHATPPPAYVEPTIVERDGETFLYPFHGALVGGPSKDAPAFHQEVPFPVYLPADEVTVGFSWRALGPTSGLRFSVLGADGTLVRSVPLDGLEGAITIALTQDELTSRKHPNWSAGYWTGVVDLDGGAVEWDMDARAAYDGGVLPLVVHAPPPPPPPPAARVPRAPIAIASDADFTAANGVTDGSGTPDDPYIIEGWDIDPAAGVGISIGGTLGTTSHVVIRNVRVHDTNGNCIDLTRVQHLTLRDSVFDGCDFSFHSRGGSDLLLEDNVFESSARGPAFYGASSVVLRGNLLRDLASSGIIIGQGFTQQSTVSTDVLIEDNVLLGPGSSLMISSPVAIGVEMHGNALGEGAYLDLQIAPTLPTISDTLWLDGVPQIIWRMLTVPHDPLPIATIVDAGSDRRAGGRVCFDDARADVAGATITDITWHFGDGGVSSELAACHDYAPGSYEARLTVTISMPDGSTRVLGDSVLVD